MTDMVQNQKRKMSQQMRAVLAVLSADPYLLDVVVSHIDIPKESIFWDEIFKMPLGSGHRAAIDVAYGIWTDEQRPETNIFSSTLRMDSKLQSAVLHALAIRWGLAS